MDYRTWVAAGTLAGLAWTLWRTPRGAWLRALDTLVLAAGAALAAGRIGFVLLNWDYFTAQPGHMLALGAAPGYSEHAALVGAWIVGAWRRQAMMVILVALTVGIGAALGCIEAGCGFGRELFPGEPWFAFAADWPDAYTLRNPRWPVQAMLSAWLVPCLALAALLGAAGLVGAVAAGDFVLQFLRADSVPVVAGLRVPQWFDLMLLGAAVAIRLRQALLRRQGQSGGG